MCCVLCVVCCVLCVVCCVLCVVCCVLCVVCCVWRYFCLHIPTQPTNPQSVFTFIFTFIIFTFFTKLENLLLAGPNFTLKLADFGLSRTKRADDPPNIDSLFSARNGTEEYMAPELLGLGRFTKFKEKYNGASVDYWAAGATIYTMVFERHFFRYDVAHFKIPGKFPLTCEFGSGPYKQRFSFVAARIYADYKKGYYSPKEIYEYYFGEKSFESFWEEEFRDRVPTWGMSKKVSDGARGVIQNLLNKNAEGRYNYGKNLLTNGLNEWLNGGDLQLLTEQMTQISLARDNQAYRLVVVVAAFELLISTSFSGRLGWFFVQSKQVEPHILHLHPTFTASQACRKNQKRRNGRETPRLPPVRSARRRNRRRRRSYSEPKGTLH